ncbi:MAG TPA: diguanylate cyclase [Methylomirabilota bacterium]|jgi:diguanylate cyclase (GGDEF)-like protein|nr:diguanylate cyclase [Methylomirabilota bacterium]
MAVDVPKQLERAKRYLEKNKLADAVEAYQAVLEAIPNHLESLQALGDLYSRLGQYDHAAVYFGFLFDRFTDPADEPKALALYSRFLKNTQQTPERVARYAVLLQKQNRNDEAIEQYTAASEKFLAAGKEDYAVACLERIAQLDSENAERHIALGEMAERLGKNAIAARGFLRAGQLVEAAGDIDRALDLLARAQRLAPGERGAALIYAQALLRKGDAAAAAALLAPLAESEHDAAFLETYGVALLRSADMERARTVLTALAKLKPTAWSYQMEIANQYLAAHQEEMAIATLGSVKTFMIQARRENEFAAELDKLAEAHPRCVTLIEFWGGLYSELNREAKYFDVLARLFDLYLAEGKIDRACDTLERLVDIDAYDPRNQERLRRLETGGGSEVVAHVRARLQQSDTHGGTAPPPVPSEPSVATNAVAAEEKRSENALDDLIVQAEIFIQYSLPAKAVERLKKIAELYPGEVERNERLINLCQLAQWWPEGARARIEAGVQRTAADTGSPAAPGDAMRDLARISEISQNLFRQPTPRAILSTAVNEAGSFLRAARCIALIGARGQPPQLAAEFCASGFEPAAGPSIMRLLGLVERATPDAMGGLRLDAAATPFLRELGLDSALGVVLTDRDAMAPAGMLIAGLAVPHAWKPNEIYFLQSVGDQMLLGINHTRLRSLVRNLAVADEKTGLLRRSSYPDCLLRESQRAKTQGASLSVAILQLDHGSDLLQQQGEAQLDRHMEQVVRALQPVVRHADLAVKYTPWSLAFILPDTNLDGARTMLEKLFKTAAGVRPPWDGARATLSGVVAEAVVRPEYDSEDIVTELINRVDSSLEQARRRGGDTIVAIETGHN